DPAGIRPDEPSAAAVAALAPMLLSGGRGCRLRRGLTCRALPGWRGACTRERAGRCGCSAWRRRWRCRVACSARSLECHCLAQPELEDRPLGVALGRYLQEPAVELDGAGGLASLKPDAR